MAEPAVTEGTTSRIPARRKPSRHRERPLKGPLRGRGPRRRTAALLLAAVPLLAGLTPVPAAHPAQAQARTQAHTQAQPSDAVRVSLDQVRPTVPAPDDTLTVSGTLLNRADVTVTDAHVSLRVRGPLGSRSAIVETTRRGGFLQGIDGQEVPGKGTKPVADLRPHVARSFSLRIPVKDLPLGRDGVYQLAVTVSGQSERQPYQHVQGIQRSFLPWQADAGDSKTQVTFLWPLISSRPSLTARTLADETQTPVFADDRLEKELKPGGRLQQLLELGTDLPVTFVVDPDLIASVDAMTHKYRIASPDGGDRTTPGRGQANAKAWLAELEDAVKGHELIALPFADPDVASLAHHGVAKSLAHLKDATDLAERTISTVLHVKPRTDFTWPVNGALDQATVDTATSAGARNVIARSDSLRETSLTYTPTAARPIGKGTTAVVADARLSRLFEGDMTRAGNATLAVQEFLAQTQMITLQQPSKERSVVIAPQRTPTTQQAHAMASAMQGLGQAYWTTPQDLSKAAKATPDPGANRRVPGYPSRLRRGELPRASLGGIQQTQRQLDDFQVILTEPQRVLAPIGTAILRELSTQWRGDPNGAIGFREDVRDYLDNLSSQVQLIEKSAITLSGRSGTIPVTVQNQLVQDVKGLKLKLTSNSPKLKLGDEQPIEVGGGHSASVKFDTEARANGPVEITAQLYTEDGRKFGQSKTFKVQVTSITSTVLLVIGIGILLLVLAGVRMYTQRKRAAAAEPAEDGPAEQAEASGGDDTGGSGDAPGEGPTGGDDTGPESGTPSGTGEKVDR